MLHQFSRNELIIGTQGLDILKDKKTLIREIHKKYVNPEIRRYVYEKLEF